MSSISGMLLKGSFWITLSRAFTNGLAVLSTFVLAWYLSPADFGLVAIGTTLLMILTSATEFSLTAALIRHPNPDDSHLNAAWTLNALRGLALCLLIWGAAYPASWTFDDARLVNIMFALGLSLFIGGLANPRLAMAQRALLFWQDFVVSTGQKLAGFIAAAAVAIAFQSYWALVVGTLATQLVNVILSYVVLPFRPRIVFRYFREFFGFSAWLTASQVVNTLNWRFDQLLVGKMFGGTALGYYTMGSNLARIPTRESTAPLMNIVFPAFASVRGDKPRLAAAYQRAQAVVTAVALPAGIGAATIADPLVRLALGEKWLPAIFVIQALGAVYALQTLGSLAQPLGMAQGETRRLFVRDTQMLIVRVPVMILGALVGGLTGVVFGRVFTGLLAAFVNMLLVRDFVGLSVRTQLSANARSLVSSGILVAVTLATMHELPVVQDKVLQSAQLALLIAVAAVTYCGSMAALWLTAGRPLGAETEFSRLSVKALNKIRRPSDAAKG